MLGQTDLGKKSLLDPRAKPVMTPTFSSKNLSYHRQSNMERFHAAYDFVTQLRYLMLHALTKTSQEETALGDTPNASKDPGFTYTATCCQDVSIKMVFVNHVLRKASQVINRPVIGRS